MFSRLNARNRTQREREVYIRALGLKKVFEKRKVYKEDYVQLYVIKKEEEKRQSE